MKQPESDQQNQQKCEKCGKIVGCDYQGREHKCDCGRGDNQMETVYAYYQYEDSDSPATLQTMHKTEDGANTEMRKHQKDGFVMPYTIHD